LKKSRVLLLLLLLTACKDGGGPKQPALGDPVAVGTVVSPGVIQVFTTKVPRGLVVCVTWRSYEVGGISCDWEHVQ
jgi:hypothetical protein